MTWRVRRIGRTLWSAIRARGGSSWLAIEDARRAAETEPSARDGVDGADRRSAPDEPRVTDDAFHSLEALRLDRAAYAVREPD